MTFCKTEINIFYLGLLVIMIVSDFTKINAYDYDRRQNWQRYFNMLWQD